MPDWLNVDQRVDHAFTELDKRIDRVEKIGNDLIDRFQEALNGIKITANLEMPVVKKAESVK